MKTKLKTPAWLVATLIVAVSISPTSVAEDSDPDSDAACEQAVEQTAEDAMISNDSQASAEDSVARTESHCLGASNGDEQCNQAIGDAATSVVETEDPGAFAEAVEDTLLSPECQTASPGMIAQNENLIMALNAIDDAGYTLTEVGSSETSGNSIIQQALVDASAMLNAINHNIDTCPTGGGPGSASLWLEVGSGPQFKLNEQPAFGEYRKTAGVSTASIQSAAYGISGEASIMQLHIAGLTLPGFGGVKTDCGEVVSVTCVWIFCEESITIIACKSFAYGSLIGDGSAVDLKITARAKTPGC